MELVNGGAKLKQEGKEVRLSNLSHPHIELDVISLDPPPHKLDKHMDNLKRVELRIPVSGKDDAFEIKVQLAGR